MATINLDYVFKAKAGELVEVYHDERVPTKYVPSGDSVLVYRGEELVAEVSDVVVPYESLNVYVSEELAAKLFAKNTCKLLVKNVGPFHLHVDLRGFVQVTFEAPSEDVYRKLLTKTSSLLAAYAASSPRVFTADPSVISHGETTLLKLLAISAVTRVIKFEREDVEAISKTPFEKIADALTDVLLYTLPVATKFPAAYEDEDVTFYSCDWQYVLTKKDVTKCNACVPPEKIVIEAKRKLSNYLKSTDAPTEVLE